ncbi:CCA tRNA nucleotidyltransferase [Thalassospira xianhensis]|uniref:tRNA nucleotidyltransferase n=1 Tax=Thalassospira xianhensis MCCC 1A02616 TaxID=1177929 RepID=A0A367UBR9_9PROT|nr:CCA tRNA nucleotidyltransferase [Thalassospira xianhensis]RCK05688.1 tRNA nucleotidyltransferase [Thalassospira xianhensis MCCC 1A02616]
MTALTATGHLQPYGIMTHPDTVRVFDAIAAHGGKARFVGGLVRDALLKRDLVDVDIACDLKPEETVIALEKAGLKVVPTGLKHGTVTAVTDAATYEITTLRIDVTTDGRHAEVAFTDSWLGDAKRRDFTFNAIYCDQDGTIYDPFDGETDLREGRVRFIGIAEDRIAEDYLRIMRFFRFHAWFGRPPLDPIGAEACRKGAHGLRNISPERLRDETLKLLRSRSPAATIKDMIGFKVLPVILPDLADTSRLRMMEWLDSNALADPAIRPDPLRRLAALYRAPENTDDDFLAATDFGKGLRLSNDETERFAAMISDASLISADMSEDTTRRDLYRLGVDAFRDAVLIAWAARASVPPRPGSVENKQWQGLLQAANDWVPVKLPIQGRDILVAGLAPAGPQMGRLLKLAEEYWLANAFVPGPDELMAYLAAQSAAKLQE